MTTNIEIFEKISALIEAFEKANVDAPTGIQVTKKTLDLIREEARTSGCVTINCNKGVMETRIFGILIERKEREHNNG